MGLFKKDIEPSDTKQFGKEDLTRAAEGYRQVATEHQEAAKEMRKTFLKTGVFAVAALIAVLIITLSWFVNNNRVSVDGTAISANAHSVELRSYGGAGIHDDVLRTIMGENGSKGFWYKLTSVFTDPLDTSGKESAINWLLKDDSNVGNYSTEKNWPSYWEGSSDMRHNHAIEPGKKGEISFYLVPQISGDITVHCDLSLIPYKIVSGNYMEVSETEQAKKFIDGHILFFLETEGDGNKKQLIWINDGSFDVTITNAVSNEEYKYTLYWCWPMTFAEAILKDGDSYLNSREPLFSDFVNGEEMRRKVLMDDPDYSMKNHPERYFYSNLTQSPLHSSQAELSELQNIYNNQVVDLSENKKVAFVELSSYYNQADQYIGGHVNCVRIRLTVSL